MQEIAFARNSRFQNFPGEHASGPPRMAHAFGVRPPPKTMTLATALYNHVTNGMIDSLLMLRLTRACLNLAMLTSFFGVWHNLCSEFLLDG